MHTSTYDGRFNIHINSLLKTEMPGISLQSSVLIS
jgi:hypothetical protein